PARRRGAGHCLQLPGPGRGEPAGAEHRPRARGHHHRALMTMSAPRKVVIDVFPESAFRYRGRDAVACIDVMLATTTLVTAAARGWRGFVAAGVEEARSTAGRLGGALVAGGPEEGAQDTFEIADGPCALAGRPAHGRPL